MTGKADGGGVGFVQSVIDWKCKPESVRRPTGRYEWKRRDDVGERGTRKGKEDRTSALVRTDRWPLVSTTAWRNSPIGKTAFRLSRAEARHLVRILGRPLIAVLT